MIAIASGATHWCELDGTFIFLDLNADRYFALEQGAANRFSRIVRGERVESDEEWLTARGLHNLAPQVHRSSPEAITPTASVLEQAGLQKPTALGTARAVWALTLARRQVRNLPLKTVLSGCSRAAPKPRQVQRSDALRTAAAFHRARHYVSGIDDCLSRGVAMRRVLAGTGCEARLVIGVTLPFAAHCWVQLGSDVLTDPLDVVTPYTPILVV